MKQSVIFFNTKKLKPCLLLLLSLIIMSACDKVEPPYMEQANSSSGNVDTTETFVQKVLIEDFTGHTCTNCPAASEKLEELITLYGDKIVPMAIHVGWFAQPAGANYPEDFTTPEGDAIDAVFLASTAGLPQGMVNRKEEAGNRLVAASGWASLASQILALDPQIGLTITNAYDTATRQVDINVKTTFLNDFNENLKLVVMITEDSIIAPQLVDNVYTPDYKHMHMLKDGITDVWGDLIVNGSVPKDEIKENNYSYTLDATWKEKYCNIVAYIYYENSYEIVQADFKPVVE